MCCCTEHLDTPLVRTQTANTQSIYIPNTKATTTSATESTMTTVTILKTTDNNSIADSKTVYITSGDSGVLKELGTDSKWATSLITAHQFPITTTVLDTIFSAGKSKSGEADHSTGVFLYCCAVLTLKSKTESLSTSCCSRSSGDR